MEKSAEMTPEEVVLYKHVYVPVFIEKCASRGVRLTQEDLGTALETTALVKSAMAQKQGSQIKTANANLKKILGVEPIEAAQKAQAKTASLAKQLGQNPEVRQAVLKGLGLVA